MNLHNYLNQYKIDDTYYSEEGYTELTKFLLEYSNAHPWFHYYTKPIFEINYCYFHLAVMSWTEGGRPTLYIFNFKRSNTITEEWNKMTEIAAKPIDMDFLDVGQN